MRNKTKINSEKNFWDTKPKNDKNFDFNTKNDKILRFLPKFWILKSEFFCHFWFPIAKKFSKSPASAKEFSCKIFLDHVKN